MIKESEIEFSAIRAQGAGGQHVNKVSSAIHLQFSIPQSSLSDTYKERLLAFNDYRISKEGTIAIKAQRFRRQEQNKQDAIERLHDLIRRATAIQKVRRATRPTKASQKRRLESKNKKGNTKKLRRSPHSRDE